MTMLYPKRNHKPQRLRRGKTSSKRSRKGKRESIPWTPDDLEVLARARVKASTNPIIAGIFQHAWNNRKSGEDDAAILSLAVERYTTKHEPWNYMRPYEIFRKCEKWKVVPSEVSEAKRSKTSVSGSYSAGGSDARCVININDDPEFEDEAPSPEPGQPTGRDRAKKADAQKAFGFKGTSLSDASKLDTILQKLNHIMGVQEDRYKKKEKEKEETVTRERERLEFDRRRLEFDIQNQEAEEFRLMRTDIESVSEKDRAVLSRMKDKITKKW